MSIRIPRFSTSAALAIGGGLSVALSLPPWGIWPLAFLGVAMFEMSLGETPSPRARAARGWLFAAVWMFPGMAWMWSLTIPGYFAAVSDLRRVPRRRRGRVAARPVAGHR